MVAGKNNTAYNKQYDNHRNSERMSHTASISETSEKVIGTRRWTSYGTEIQPSTSNLLQTAGCGILKE
jgi:hypothetical protein